MASVITQAQPKASPSSAGPVVWMVSFLAAIIAEVLISDLIVGHTPWKLVKTYKRTVVRVRFSLVTISAIIAIGFLTRYSGLGATMRLAFARAGTLYPVFGTLLGWLGVVLTGWDTSSNVLFGSVQRISAEQVGVSANLMAAANSCGGVMGKMIDAQSIVTSNAAEWYGHEGDILRYVFFHSIALAALVGITVTFQAYVFPFTRSVVR